MIKNIRKRTYTMVTNFMLPFTISTSLYAEEKYDFDNDILDLIIPILSKSNQSGPILDSTCVALLSSNETCPLNTNDTYYHFYESSPSNGIIADTATLLSPTTNQADINVITWSTNNVSIVVERDELQNWFIDIAAPFPNPLEVGEYNQTTENNSDILPKLVARNFGELKDCIEKTEVPSNFVIHEIAFDDENLIKKLAVNFNYAYHCDDEYVGINGTIRFNSKKMMFIE